MKKIEACIRSEVAKEVVNAISDLGVGGVTLIQSLGKGSGDRPWVGGEKGHRLEFNAIDMVVTVVEDSKVDDVTKAITNTAYTGEKGDGIIFVTDVVGIINIDSKTS